MSKLRFVCLARARRPPASAQKTRCLSAVWRAASEFCVALIPGRATDRFWGRFGRLSGLRLEPRPVLACRAMEHLGEHVKHAGVNEVSHSVTETQLSLGASLPQNTSLTVLERGS